MTRMTYRILRLGVVLGMLALMMQSCYYDVEEELYGTQPCDTSNVTFAGTVQPILNLNCVSCHSGPNPPGNVSLDSYNNVKIQADNGALMGALNHAAGYSPMPKNGSKLSTCERRKIQLWIDGGTQNN